jgi:ABC-type transport system involved in cytochrome bd biosynthesis fused ATPase/permease subunit
MILERYLADLKRLTARFLGLRTGAALIQVIGLGLALTAAFALLARGQLSVASFAVLIPGVSMLSGMINSFLYQYRVLSGLVAPTSGRLMATLSSGEEVRLATATRAILFQEPAHFPFSIRHNVTMRFEQVLDEEECIWDALRHAGLEAVVRALPDGLDTVVGAGFGGTTDLSGGQWQRLALARLLYHDAPLLMLGEPSASLDPVGERQIFELLARLSREKTILFATHRYDTIRQADTIAVLVDGRTAEMGTHDELEQNAREFWSLYLAQSSFPVADHPPYQKEDQS